MFAAFKGWLGEKAAQAGMWLRLDGRIYRRAHNLIIPSGGGTTQIDHVIVSVHGIFVVETKNMKGWIFGDERSHQFGARVGKFGLERPSDAHDRPLENALGCWTMSRGEGEGSRFGILGMLDLPEVQPLGKWKGG